MLERCSGDASLTLSEAMRSTCGLRVPPIARAHCGAAAETLVNVDAEFLATAKAEKLADGTTAVMVAVTGDARLVHANVGDSESVLCRHASHRSPAPPRGDDDDDDDGDGDDDNAPREQITAASIAVIPLSEIHNPSACLRVLALWRWLTDTARRRAQRQRGGAHHRQWRQAVAGPLVSPRYCAGERQPGRVALHW